MKAIAYQVTAVRGDFRRVGRTFKHRVTTLVDASALTPAQVEFLEASDPRRELLVVAVHEPTPAPAAVVELEADGIGTSPSEPTPAPRKGRGR